MRAVSGARVRRRLGYHHDHRRVGATGMVVLMEPGGRPSLGQVSSCQCTMVGPGPCAVCFPSRRTCHWPCPWRLLVVCYCHKREVTGPRGLCDSRSTKWGRPFLILSSPKGPFFLLLSCTAVHLRAVHMALFRPAGPRDVVCSRNISPCSGVYAPSPDDRVRDGP